jgi:mRNA interferase MazF
VRYDPWSVLWVDLDPRVGREQAGRRPAIVVGSPLAAQIGQRNDLIIVVPCTTTDRGLPWHPPVTLGDRRGVAMCEQIKAISLQRVRGAHRAVLSPEEIAAVKQALRRLLDL